LTKGACAEAGYKHPDPSENLGHDSVQNIDNQIQLAKRYNNQYCGKLLNKLFTKWLLKYKTKTQNTGFAARALQTGRFVYRLVDMFAI